MLTLSKGYKKPQNGVDSGVVWFPAMEANIQQLNDHTHNGTDSQLLAMASVTYSHTGWSAASVGGGLYQQTITMPGSFLYDSTAIFFRLSTGEAFYPSVVRVSNTQYQIFCNDNTLDVTAFYR